MLGKKLVICVDFDGTCVTYEFPKVGKEIGAVEVLKRIIRNGHKLVLFTMRGNNGDEDYLIDAVKWFEKHDIPLHGVNVNPTQHHWTNSPKAFGNLYIDDAALGCPLIHNLDIADRPFVDWEEIEFQLVKTGVLHPELKFK